MLWCESRESTGLCVCRSCHCVHTTSQIPPLAAPVLFMSRRICALVSDSCLCPELTPTAFGVATHKNVASLDPQEICVDNGIPGELDTCIINSTAT